ncbi:MAG: SDR family oxidoreductase [Bradymonadaceae bacterium]
MSQSEGRAREVLLTGFPRYVARLVLEQILERETETTVRLLVPAGRRDEAVAEIDELGAEDRISLLEGEASAIDLGIGGSEYLDLVANVTDIYHVPRPVPADTGRRQLVDTHRREAQNILDVAADMTSLNRVNHLSSALVSGTRTGVIMETDFDEGQSFRNGWEEAKFEAERAIRGAPASVPTTIYRPTLIVGHSETGQLDRLNGPYYLLGALVQMPEGVPLFVPGEGQYPLNLVPVDFVARAIHALSLTNGAEDETYHLCDPDPFSARRLFELVARRAGNPPRAGNVPFKMTKWLMKVPGLRRWTRTPRQLLESIDHLAVYNAVRARTDLPDAVRCPPFTGYVDALVDHLEQVDLDFRDASVGHFLGVEF